MNVKSCDKGINEAIYRSKLEKVLKTCDVITLHVDYNPTTDKLLGKKEFGLIRKGCFLINTSRGEIIDETALVTALKSKGCFYNR